MVWSCAKYEGGKMAKKLQSGHLQNEEEEEGQAWKHDISSAMRRRNL